MTPGFGVLLNRVFVSLALSLTLALSLVERRICSVPHFMCGAHNKNTLARTCEQCDRTRCPKDHKYTRTGGCLSIVMGTNHKGWSFNTHTHRTGPLCVSVCLCVCVCVSVHRAATKLISGILAQYLVIFSSAYESECELHFISEGEFALALLRVSECKCSYLCTSLRSGVEGILAYEEFCGCRINKIYHNIIIIINIWL